MRWMRDVWISPREVCRSECPLGTYGWARSCSVTWRWCSSSGVPQCDLMNSRIAWMSSSSRRSPKAGILDWRRSDPSRRSSTRTDRDDAKCVPMSRAAAADKIRPHWGFASWDLRRGQREDTRRNVADREHRLWLLWLRGPSRWLRCRREDRGRATMATATRSRTWKGGLLHPLDNGCRFNGPGRGRV